jgi:hypothetical protein
VVPCNIIISVKLARDSHILQKLDVMFSTSVQPEIVSLFSSTGSEPLSLFSIHTDPSLPVDSFIHFLDDTTSQPPPPPPATMISQTPAEEPDCSDPLIPTGYMLDQTVLHIQSPTLPTTFVRCPPEGRSQLGMKHPWLHLQVRNMGREWAFEIGLVDQTGSIGVVRCSTFQVYARLFFNAIDQCIAYRCTFVSNWHRIDLEKASLSGIALGSNLLLRCAVIRRSQLTQKLPQKQPQLKPVDTAIRYPLLHLPISFPRPSPHRLTAWSTIALHLPPLLAQFSSLSLLSKADNEGPSSLQPSSRTCRTRGRPPLANYSHVAYVKVYATCRLRRIWFSESGPNQKLPWEFELYCSE